MISKLDVNHGIAGFLLANGALNDPDEYENRKRLLQNDKVEAIIVLPRDMFYSTDSFRNPLDCKHEPKRLEP